MKRLESNQGARQGDPLCPLLFSYAYRSRIERLTELVSSYNAEVVSYLDDTLIWIPHDSRDSRTSREQAQALLNCIKSDFSTYRTDGLSLNISKCSIHTIEYLRSNGCEILGTYIGSVEGRRQFLRGKVKRFDDKLRRVTPLPRESALLLTRSCIAPSLLHLLRTLDSTDLEDIWSEANHALIRSVQQFASVRAEPDLDQTARCLATLPLKFGGLGLPNYPDLIPHSRWSSRELCDKISHHIELFNERPSNADREFMSSSRSPNDHQNYLREKVDDLLNGLDDKKRLAMVENSSALGSAWLRMIPLYPSLSLTDRQVSSALQLRLLISAPSVPCPSCNEPDSLLHGEWCQRRSTAPVVLGTTRFAIFWRAVRPRSVVRRRSNRGPMPQGRIPPLAGIF